MNHVLVAILVVMVFCEDSHSQAKLKFRSHNYAGILEGQKGTSFQLQSINGIEKRTWFAGIGTGLDYYYFRSIPLFLSLNKSFCECERSFFLSLDGGINWFWDKNTENRINTSEGNFKPSLYWASGFGYRIGLKNKKDAILINVGYSIKHLRETVNNPGICQFPPCIDYSERVDYRFRRLSFKAGWRF